MHSCPQCGASFRTALGVADHLESTRCGEHEIEEMLIRQELRLTESWLQEQGERQ